MKILFKNETKYNKEIYENFLNFHNKKFHFKYTLYTAAIIMLLIFCLSLQVKYHNYTLAILFGIFLSAFFLWRFLHPISIAQKELKSKKIENKKTFYFIFYEDKFKIRDNENYNIMPYFKLYKIFETENFFGSVHNNSLSSLVTNLYETDKLSSQDIDELIRFLEEVKDRNNDK